MLEILVKIRKTKKSRKVKHSKNSLFQSFGIKEAHEGEHSYKVYIYGHQSLVTIGG